MTYRSAFQFSSQLRIKRGISGLVSRLVLGAIATFTSVSAHADVNIYSYRQLNLIQPVLDAFTAETGIETKAVFIKKGLVERISREGRNSPADLILTTDISRLSAAKNAGVTQVLNNADAVEAGVISRTPEAYRDAENNWFGLTVRGRVIYASVDRVDQNAITYEELADPKWAGRICLRSGQHAYNIALFSSMIAHMGEEKAEEWMKGLKANLARKPNGNDRAQAKGIYSGECDLGIGNTYYVGLMKTNMKDVEQQDWAKSLKVLFPNSNDRGTHVNISGMALAKHAPNRADAVKLMDFLSSQKAQEIYAEAVFEYPVLAGVEASDLVKSIGALNADQIELEKIAELSKKASEMVDRVGFNN